MGEGPAPKRPVPAASDSLLTNAPFGQWSTQGPWTRDADTASTGSGQASRLWREVDVEPGKRYVFTVSAKQTGDGKNNGAIELRLEGTLTNYQVTLNSEMFRAADLPNADKSAPLSVAATAVSPKLRVSIIYSPADGSQAAPLTIQTPTLAAR